MLARPPVTRLAVGPRSGPAPLLAGVLLAGLAGVIAPSRAASDPAMPVVVPHRLEMEAVPGGAAVYGTVTVRARASGRTIVRPSDAVPWLRIVPAFAVLDSGQAHEFVVEVLPAILEAGTHVEPAVFEFDSAWPGARAVPVMLHVRSPGASVDRSTIGVRALLLRDRTGDASAQYLELAAFGDGETLRRSFRLRLQDRNGATLFEGDDLFGAELDGVAWPAGSTLLLASPTLAERLPAPPDAPLPAPLDPIGGTITLWRELAGGVVEQRVHYGTRGGSRAPPPGSALERTAPGRFVPATPLPAALWGHPMSLIEPSCPPNTVRAGGVTQTPVAPRASVTNGNWRASYDIPRGEIAASGSAQATVRDRFHVTGIREGAPVTFTAALVLHGDTWGGGSGQHSSSGGIGASLRIGSGPSVNAGGIPGGDPSEVHREALLPITVRAHEAFDLTWSMTTSMGDYGGGAYGRAILSFRDVPAGIEIRSCQGYRYRRSEAPSPVPMEARRAGGEARLRWWVPGPPRLVVVERRAGADGWTPIAVAEVGRDEELSVIDAGLSGNGPFDYRLDVDGVATAEVRLESMPEPGALHLAGGNPVRGPLRLAVELPDDGDAALDLVAVTGRRVARVELTGRGPGLVPIGADFAPNLGAGLYLLRLAAGGEVHVRKVLVIP
jgi:hypothetical protein